MYQGKFDKKKKNSTMDIHDITASRNAAVARKKAQAAAAAETPAPRKKPEAAPVYPPVTEAPAPRKNRVPFDQDAPVGRSAAKPQSAPQRKPAQEAVQAAEPRRRGPRLGGVIFYTLYFLFIFLFFVAVYFGLQWGYDWLCDYEAAQPTAKAEEVFQQLFEDPDWAALYDAAGIADTPYEGRDAFVAYMENLVGDTALTYQQTSTGLATDTSKYFIKLNDQRLGYFILTDSSSASQDTGLPLDITYIPDWTLGEIGLFYERTNSYRIQTVNGHVPTVNGVSLTEDHIIQISTSRNDSSGFLPEGVTTAQSSIYEITDLIAAPVITVVDSEGNEMSVVYDEDTAMYVEQAQEVSISEEERELALNALKVYAKYQVKEAGSDDVARYFSSTGEAYSNIMKTVLSWTKGNRGISFENDTVTNYCRYSDTMFSVYATTEMTINLTDGGSQTKPINNTLLFEKLSSGWKVTKMTNANVSETVGKVRLTFMNGDVVLSSDFYDIDSESFATPLLSVPEGKVFSGWYRETVSADGSIQQNLIFEPDENGEVTIPSGTTLEPMTLYPLFENAA